MGQGFIELNLQTRLREKIKERGITVSELCRRSGLSRNCVDYILEGVTMNPGCRTLLAIAHVLECNVSDFLDGDKKQLCREEMAVWNCAVKMNLKEIRERQGLKKKDVARKTGVDSGEISRMEKSQKKNPSIKSIFKIAKILNCSVDDLIELVPVKDVNTRK